MLDLVWHWWSSWNSMMITHIIQHTHTVKEEYEVEEDVKVYHTCDRHGGVCMISYKSACPGYTISRQTVKKTKDVTYS